MKKNTSLTIVFVVISVIFALALNGCGRNSNSSNNNDSNNNDNLATQIFKGKELFTSQELDGEVDGIDFEYDLTTIESKDLTIAKEGIYKLTGSVSDMTIVINVDSSEEVQLVLDNVNITNKNKPCINVVNGNKVFITTTESTNTFEVSEKIVSSKEDNYDATIYSKSDIVFNGLGSLSIKSSQNGVTGKDDVKITCGTYTIEANGTAIIADNSIRIADGIINLKAVEDGLHAENEYGDALGYVYIKNGTISILSSNYGIRAGSVMQMDKGTLKVSSSNGVGGTFVQINNGDIAINSQDQGISVYEKSDSYEPTLEVNGGNVSINMSGVETNAIYSVGDINLYGGKVDVVGPATIKYDGKANVSSGVLTINGTKKNKI